MCRKFLSSIPTAVALSLSAVAGFAVVGLTTGVRANTLLNFQVMGAAGNTAITEQTGAAAIGTSGDSWNYLFDSSDLNGWPTLNTVVNSADTVASGVTASFQADHWQPSTTSGDVPILSNAGYQGSTVKPLLTIGGLGAGQEYDLVAYVGFSPYAFGDNSITVNGTAIGTLPADNVTTLVSGTNYLKQTVFASNSGTIAIGAVNALSGAQLQAVPEPASLGLVGLGALCLLVKRRRST